MVGQRAQLRLHRTGASDVARPVERLRVPREWVRCAPAKGEERLTRRETARPVTDSRRGHLLHEVREKGIGLAADRPHGRLGRLRIPTS